MFLEPAQTPYDLNFRLWGVPIRVTPWFWLTSLLITNGAAVGGIAIMVCILASFLSILIHELGHAAAYLSFGMRPHVVLYQFGGLAIADRMGGGRGSNQGARANILISLAGPVLQIAAGVFVFALVRALGYDIAAPLSIMEGRFPDGPNPIPSYELLVFLTIFSRISISWALLNLLPVFPLDGGQIARSLFMLYGGPSSGLRNSIQLSLVIAIGAAVGFFQLGSPSAGLMFMVLAFSNYQLLNQDRGRGIW